MRPTWRSYRFVVAVTAVWAAETFTFNSIAGTNYGFLNGKPATTSVLDLTGPWPVYVVTGGRARPRGAGVDDMALGAGPRI